MPCARLSLPSGQLLSACKYIVSYHIVSCRRRFTFVNLEPTVMSVRLTSVTTDIAEKVTKILLGICVFILHNYIRYY